MRLIKNTQLTYRIGFFVVRKTSSKGLTIESPIELSQALDNRV